MSSTLAGNETPALLNRMSSRPVRRHHRVHHLGPVLFRCHVEVQVARFMAVGAQGCRRALAQLIADVGQHHLRALAHEQMGRRAAEAHQLALDRSRRAGQQRYLAPQSHCVLPLDR
jgi:hypothetical protein